MTVTEGQTSDEFWIFGYGSLIFKPPPHIDRQVPGYITGYVRRFWQVSFSRNSPPPDPGRVVTLIERSVWEKLGDHHDADEVVWGTAYRVEASHVEEVKEYLDIREINGYSIHYVDVHHTNPNSPPIRSLVYIGTPENPQFVARERVPGETELAEHIYKSVGPSGPNKDYLYQLHHALEDLCPDSKDNHIRSLFRKIAILEAEEKLMEIEEEDHEEHEEDKMEDIPFHEHPSGQEETEPNMTSS
ncbi:ChaC-domain-containing protein [Ascodesmis nigricans]|uniref:glutathione-specific gamma-glutamylcyclotransferase n=1 Tax=Ascodesmis nigricans TaxID=341454 RepID=A0A4S2MYS5_9PEZI|nr:ChaC-domain-containing protein [Ascodesmis nigricans]